ncbi:Glucose 1-dehydrogenase 2 [Orchesella cincta]|uniref:Glucose 1-dehydrogenase 2 n=1 Tax=Orchesella cincta TaxID=48709 RepID=A0A1D2N3I0_ORCCI|nr:Glucose 1-dehydrogenase 2 [Orchesella cincta]
MENRVIPEVAFTQTPRRKSVCERAALNFLEDLLLRFQTSEMATENISFKNKVVLVTGSSSGMGLAMNLRFAKLGAKVVVQGRDEKKMAEAVQQCTAASPFGYKPLQVKADVGVDADLINLVNKVIATYGQLDVLVNNAGVIALSPIDDPELMKKFDNQMKINVRAPVLLCSLCAPHLEKTKGNIVNISSGIGMRAFPGAIGYSVSKWAVMMITEGLALELGPKGVRVNTINPGFIENQAWHDKAGYGPEVGIAFKKGSPLGRNGTVQDIVNCVVFLTSDEASYINAVAVPVDGGITKTIQGTSFD